MTELNLPLEAQLRGFLLAAAAGVLLGALYDVLRVYRILFRPPKGLVFALDVFTLCTAALVTFLTSLAASRGVLRFYLFLGEAAGWAAYACTVGRVTVFLARWLLRLLRTSGFSPFAPSACRTWGGSRPGFPDCSGFVEKNRAASEKSLET